jgi:salicylate hydroxylase
MLAPKPFEAFSPADRRLVIYPCRNGELLNFVAIHPSTHSSDVKSSSWLASGSREELEHVCKDFGP